MMRIPVRIPHATSSPYKGDIRTSELRSSQFPKCHAAPQRNHLVSPAFGYRPLLPMIIDPLARGAATSCLLPASKGQIREEFRLVKSLAEPVATFVIIGNY